jgi:hypothetical protein
MYYWKTFTAIIIAMYDAQLLLDTKYHNAEDTSILKLSFASMD